MSINEFLDGGNFLSYQHVVVLESHEVKGIFPLGGGNPSSVSRRFGSLPIHYVYITDNIVRIVVDKY